MNIYNDRNNAQSKATIQLLICTAIIITCYTILDINASTFFRLIVAIITIVASLQRPSLAVFMLLIGYFVPSVTLQQEYILPQPQAVIFSILLFTSIPMIYRDRYIVFEPSAKYVYLFFLILVIIVDLTYLQTTEVIFTKFIFYAMGFVVALNIRDNIDSYIVIFSISLASILIAFWHLGQLSDLLITSRESLPVDPNYLSCFICYGILSLLLITNRNVVRSRIIKSALYVILAMMFYVVLILASRGIIVALIATLAVVWLKRYRTVSLKSAGVLIALLAIVMQLPGSLSFIERFSESNMSNLNARLPLAIAAYSRIVNASMMGLLFGQGTGSGAIGLTGVIYDTATSAHNDYLEMAMDYGLVGASLFIVIYLLIMKNVFKANNLNANVKFAFVVFTLLCSLSITPHKLYVFSWVIMGYLVVNNKSDNVV